MARIYTREPVEERLERYIQRVPMTGCWIWTGASDKLGYGRINVDRKAKLTHRVSFEIHKGPIPRGLELDHLCRNPSCVNPHHLEPVTRKVNTDRGIVADVHRRRLASLTQCRRGHEYTPENTYRDSRGFRNCKKCRDLAAKKFKEKKLCQAI